MENKIKNIFEREFGVTVYEIKKLAEGYSHEKFLVKFNKAPFEAIIRFENSSLQDKAKGLGMEKWVMEKLLSQDIPAPKIYAFNNIGENTSEHYIILEKLNGIRLDTIWDTISKKEKIQITKEIGRLLKKIHGTKFDQFGSLREAGKIKPDASLFKFKTISSKNIPSNLYIREVMTGFGKDIARLISYDHEIKYLAQKILNHIAKNNSELSYSGKPTLIHGDFHRDHFFVEKLGAEWKIIGLIDFEFAASLAPEYDMIKLHRQGFFEDNELKSAFDEAYGPYNLKSVEISRLMRDIGFGCVLIDSGNVEKGLEVLREVEKKINLSG